MERAHVPGMAERHKVTIYWLMFLIPALAAVSPFRVDRELDEAIWLFLQLLLIFLIGFRYQIGGDWDSYLREYDLYNIPFDEIYWFKDPGHALVMWTSAALNLGIFPDNLISAIAFVTGLVSFCRRQPSPWLALAVAVPYLVIVVGMGYTRQSLAIGIMLMALPYLERGEKIKYFALILLAMQFHQSVALAIPIGILVMYRGSMVKILAAFVFVLVVAVTTLQAQIENAYAGYIESQMSSGGGAIRVVMSAMAAILFFAFRRYWRGRWQDDAIWTWFAILSLACLPLVSIASTAADRIALYFIPLQLAVYSRLPLLLKGTYMRTLVVVSVLLGYTAVEFVWLVYGSFSDLWIPYKNAVLLYLFTDVPISVGGELD